jgi:hypothetical protein
MACNQSVPVANIMMPKVKSGGFQFINVIFDFVDDGRGASPAILFESLVGFVAAILAANLALAPPPCCAAFPAHAFGGSVAEFFLSAVDAGDFRPRAFVVPMGRRSR